MDEHCYGWDEAWDIVCRTVSYTNHTVMPEALETWNEDLFRLRLPRIHMIVKEINERFCREAWEAFPGNWNRISKMSVLSYNQVKMANLSVIGSHCVNGVSKLHSQILKDQVFKDFYRMTPEKFTNVTNGIAHRRWLCYSNPELASLLDETIGKGYRKNPEELSEFKKFADDSAVLDRLRAIKHNNKKKFASLLHDRTGLILDTHSIFDVQVKRLHEYKRQLLNVLKIVTLYNEIKANPNGEYTPTTFVFGGKAAPGYYMAKDIIKLIWSIGKEIDNDPKVRDIIRVVYAEDYNVSMAEVLMPASDISEQISLAGKEASGTGCMKFMVNGALTIGTMDGANIEIRDAVGGDDNIFIFGLKSDEVDDLWRRGYSSLQYYNSNDRLKGAIDRLGGDFGGNNFRSMVNYFLYSHGVADPYMCLADYDSYMNVYGRMIETYRDQYSWLKKSLVNIASAGFFSSDRSIREYAKNIWHIEPVK